MKQLYAFENVLAEAVMDVVTGKTKRELLKYQIETLSESKPLNGRVALCIVFRQFSLDGGTARAFELTNLMTLQMGGDLVVFMATWDTCFSVMIKRPESDIPRAIFEIQFRKCQALKPLLFQIESALANSRRKT